MRKRDAKEEVKNNVILICIACQLQYKKLKYDKFCHNCSKIYAEVADIVEKKGASSNLQAKSVKSKSRVIVGILLRQSTKLKCNINGLRFIRVKKWCKACKNTDREKRKDYHRQADAERQQEFERMQRELFEQAKTRTNTDDTNNEDNEEGYDDEQDSDF